VAWTVEVTSEFEEWWNELSQEERISLDGMIRVLEEQGPALGPPYSVEVAGSQYPPLRQLRVPHDERQLCVLYICDDGRNSLVLLTGDYGAPDGECALEQVVGADAVYRAYLTAIKRGHH
jgi:hypothetical protein